MEEKSIQGGIEAWIDGWNTGGRDGILAGGMEGWKYGGRDGRRKGGKDIFMEEDEIVKEVLEAWKGVEAL